MPGTRTAWKKLLGAATGEPPSVPTSNRCRRRLETGLSPVFAIRVVILIGEKRHFCRPPLLGSTKHPPELSASVPRTAAHRNHRCETRAQIAIRPAAHSSILIFPLSRAPHDTRAEVRSPIEFFFDRNSPPAAFCPCHRKQKTNEFVDRNNHGISHIPRVVGATAVRNRTVLSFPHFRVPEATRMNKISRREALKVGTAALASVSVPRTPNSLATPAATATVSSNSLAHEAIAIKMPGGKGAGMADEICTMRAVDIMAAIRAKKLSSREV